MVVTNTPAILVTNQTVSELHPNVISTPNPLQGNALLMGLLYGLIHVIGPDHLGTLMTLSAALTPQRAFKTGAAWGLGHSFGLVFVAVAIMTLHHFVKVDVDTWEHYGDYVIGCSLVACATYFLSRESVFLVQQKDGTIVPQPCACHGAPPATPTQRRPRANRHNRKADDLSSTGSADRGAKKKHKWCSTYNCSDSSCDSSCAEEGCPEHSENAPLVPKDDDENVTSLEDTADPWNRDARGAVLGMLQGFCCPLGLVGMTFLATLSPFGAVTFLFTFLIISAFGTASLAAAWASLTSRGIGLTISPRSVYRTSCGLTMSLGILWIVANYCGFLDKLNYAEHLHGESH